MSHVFQAPSRMGDWTKLSSCVSKEAVDQSRWRETLAEQCSLSGLCSQHGGASLPCFSLTWSVEVRLMTILAFFSLLGCLESMCLPLQRVKGHRKEGNSYALREHNSFLRSVNLLAPGVSIMCSPQAAPWPPPTTFGCPSMWQTAWIS